MIEDLVKPQVNPDFTLWSSPDLDRFGLALTENLDKIQKEIGLQTGTINALDKYLSTFNLTNVKLIRSLAEDLGYEHYLTLTGIRQNSTIGGRIEVPLVLKRTFPKPEKFSPCNTTIETLLPEHKYSNGIVLVEDEEISTSEQTIVALDGVTTETRVVAGPVVEFRLTPNAPLRCNYLEFFVGVPTRIINIKVHAASGNPTIISSDEEVFGWVKIPFTPIDIAYIDIIVNQPLRVYSQGYKYYISLDKVNLGLAQFPFYYSYVLPLQKFNDNIYSVEVYSSEDNIPLTSSGLDYSNAVHYNITTGFQTHTVARFNDRDIELSTIDSITNDRVTLMLKVVRGALGNSLSLPFPATVINVYDDSRLMNTAEWIQSDRRTIVSETGTEVFKSSGTYYCEVYINNDPMSRKAMLSKIVDIDRFQPTIAMWTIGNRFIPPIINRCWLVIKLKRDNYLL